MSEETLAILNDIFKDDPPRTIQTLDGPVQVANICETLRLATQPQPRRNRRTTETENMATKRQKSADGLGKCAFIEALFAKGGLTMTQICDQTVAAFPGSDPAKTLATIKVRPYIMRRDGKTAEWIHEPRKQRAAAPVTPETAAPQDGTAAAPETAPAPAAPKKRGRKGGKKEGKFAFIRAMIQDGKRTYDQILAAAQAKYPAWDLALLKSGIYATRTIMRRGGDKTINWLPPAVESSVTPAPAPIPPPPAVLENAVQSVQPTQETAAAA